MQHINNNARLYHDNTQSDPSLEHNWIDTPRATMTAPYQTGTLLVHCLPSLYSSTNNFNWSKEMLKSGTLKPYGMFHPNGPNLMRSPTVA